MSGCAMAIEAEKVQVEGVAIPIAAGLGADDRRFYKPRALQYWITAGLLALITLLCFLGPHVLPIPGPSATNLGSTNLPLFSPGHLFGTDDLGRDILSRCLWGGQISIEVGLGSVFIGGAIGTSLGTSAAFFGGLVDVVIMRLVDIFLAFPALVLALAISSYLGPSERDEIIAISFFTIPAFTRYARAAALRLREQDLLRSSEVIGSRPIRTILNHMVPNIAGTLMTFAFLTVAGAMLIEATLSFLGAGIRPPEASWGNMIVEGQNYLSRSPQITFVPACFLFVTVLTLNLFGDALRVRRQ